MEDDPVNQKDDTDCQRDENSAALEGGQVQKHMGQERNRHRPSLPYDRPGPYRETEGTDRLDQYRKEACSGAQVKQVHRGKEDRDKENRVHALHLGALEQQLFQQKEAVKQLLRDGTEDPEHCLGTIKTYAGMKCGKQVREREKNNGAPDQELNHFLCL